MSFALAQAHITEQARLRKLVSDAVGTAWARLGSWDDADVDRFLALVLPIVDAGQRRSAALTEGFLALVLQRDPLAVSMTELIGPAVRGGVAPADVYRRPFVTVWTALSKGVAFEQAVAAGRARAASTAATDVQLTMRRTLVEIGEADDRIVGYQRVPDAGACPFCRLVAGQRYRTDQLMPIHAHCGCGVDIITTSSRDAFTGNRDNDLNVEGAAVHHHGELGPVLADPNHHFEELAA